MSVIRGDGLWGGLVLVPDAENRADGVAQAGAEASAQTGDVDIDGAVAGLAAGPDGGHQLLPGEGAPWMQHEMGQQVEFQSWQVELAAPDEDGPGGGVDPDRLRPCQAGRGSSAGSSRGGARMMWTSSDGSRCTDTGSRSCRVSCHVPSGSRSTARGGPSPFPAVGARPKSASGRSASGVVEEFINMIWAHSSCKAGVYGQTWRCSTCRGAEVLRVLCSSDRGAVRCAAGGDQALVVQVRPTGAIAPFAPQERSRPCPYPAMTGCEVTAFGQTNATCDRALPESSIR